MYRIGFICVYNISDSELLHCRVNPQRIYTFNFCIVVVIIVYIRNVETVQIVQVIFPFWHFTDSQTTFLYEII